MSAYRAALLGHVAESGWEPSFGRNGSDAWCAAARERSMAGPDSARMMPARRSSAVPPLSHLPRRLPHTPPPAATI